MHHVQIELLNLWYRAGDAVSARIADAVDRSRNDRGEVTGQTAMIVLLVVAAITAGGIIASRITGSANNVPASPTG